MVERDGSQVGEGEEEEVPTRKSLLDGNLLSLLLGGANSVLLQLFHSPEYFPRFAFPNKLFDSNTPLNK